MINDNKQFQFKKRLFASIFRMLKFVVVFLIIFKLKVLSELLATIFMLAFCHYFSVIIYSDNINVIISVIIFGISFHVGVFVIIFF
jgi:hypothetical protein